MRADEFLQAIDETAVLAAVREAERRTSGEVRVFVSRHALRGGDVRARAQSEFHRLDMDTTEDRNAVLFYVVPRDRAFAVIGDEAVHSHCGQDFWDKTAGAMEAEFRNGRFTEGLVAAIRRAADIMSAHFPRPDDDRNELPDGIVRD